MTSGTLETIAEYLWRSASPPELAGTTDSELLARFAEHGDRDAFTALVSRHGALVWSVCGRMLRWIHDREEAFQATFLIMARRAGAIRKRGSVRSWLYGVAVRVAVRARADSIRQRTVPPVDEMAENATSPPEQAHHREMREAIDEAVARLPARERLAVLLTCFEGRTHDESAQLLGCPRGTIATLLTRARDRLRRRLSRRGFAPALCGLTWLIAEGASPAVVPDLLAASTVGAASAIRLGLATGMTKIGTANLMEGVMRSMFLTNLKLPAIALAAVLAAGIGVWLQPRAEGQVAPGGTERATEKAAPSSSELEQLKEQIRLAEAVLQNARKRLNELDGRARTEPSAYSGGPTALPGSSGGPPGIVGKSPETIAKSGSAMGTSNNISAVSGLPGGMPAMGSGGGPPGMGAPTGMPAMGSGGAPPGMSGVPADRLRRIEQLAEELRREVEALRRESRPTTSPSPTPTR